MKYKLVVFDLDGTLVNSICDLANAVNKGLKKAGLPTHNTNEYKRFVGNGREKLIDRAMGEIRTDEKLRKTVKNTFDVYYAEHCNDNTSAYKGCYELLSELKKLGVKTAVLSNKPDEFVDKILKKVYPHHNFDMAWGKKSEYPSKPSPDALNEMLKILKVENSECLYIGDSNVDIYTAKNAKVDMLAVDWGFRERKELIDAGAGYVASDVEDILGYINET